MSERQTIQQIMDAVPRGFQPDKAGKAAARFQVELSGDEPGVWIIDVKDGACRTYPGPAEAPGATIKMTSADFAALVGGRLDAMKSFMAGRIKVSGNLGLVMQLLQWFKW